MSIKPIFINGEQRFQVKAEMRSKKDPRIRVQKQDTSSVSIENANKIQKMLFKDVAIELNQRETQGDTWGSIIEGWEIYLRSNCLEKLLPTTIEDNIRVLEIYTSVWMKIPASHITSNAVEAVFQKMIESGLSYSRVKALRSAINQVFQWGTRERRIPSHMCTPTNGVKIARPKDQLLTETLEIREIRILLESARTSEHEWFPVWAVALLTGMRSGELLALEWSDVDFTNRLITVSKSWNGRLKCIKSTKSGMWRKVPINGQLEALLLELKNTNGTAPHVLPRLARWGNGEAARILREFCLGIGITPVRFHTLRSCFATQLLQAGVPSPTVKKICGWTDEKVMNRYVRLAGVDVRGATSNLDFLQTKEAMDQIVNFADFCNKP